MTLSLKTRRIQYLLERTDMTQSQIARAVGVDRRRVLQVRKYIDLNPYTEFDGQKLRVRREALNLSMSRLAAKLRVHASQVSRWEAGKQTPWPNQWRKIVKALNCYVEDLEKDIQEKV